MKQTAIQIVTTTGKDNSTLDKVEIHVWRERYQEIPYKTRIYKATPARLARVAKLHYSYTSNMQTELTRVRYYTFVNSPWAIVK